MNRTVTLGLALGIALYSGMALVSVPTASAQSSQPWRAGGGGINIGTGIGGTAGMSLGYRQAILNDRLLGSRPDALFRGPNGALVDVDRRSGQAFLRSPDSGAFLPGSNPNRGWATGLGTGLGWWGAYLPGSSGRFFGSGGAGNSLANWIGQLPAADGLPAGTSLVVGAATPIDSWIRQLDLI